MRRRMPLRHPAGHPAGPEVDAKSSEGVDFGSSHIKPEVTPAVMMKRRQPACMPSLPGCLPAYGAASSARSTYLPLVDHLGRLKGPGSGLLVCAVM